MSKTCQVESESSTDVFIWTEAINCGEILSAFTLSFLRHHNQKIHIFGLLEDLRKIPPDNRVTLVALDTKNAESFATRSDLDLIILSYKQGHSGTAALWSEIITNRTETFLVHFDADIVFIGDVLSPILGALRNGYAIVGSRRHYRNHPGKLSPLRTLLYRFHKDSIHTHAFGFNRSLIDLPKDKLQSSINGVGRNKIQTKFFPILDFFDRISFYLAKKGPVQYFPHAVIQNDTLMSNSIDENLIMFVAAGSGCSFYYGRSTSQSQTYMKVAQESFAVYAKYLLNDRIMFPIRELPDLEDKLRRLDKFTWTLRKQI